MFWQKGTKHLFYSATAFYHVGEVVETTPTHVLLKDCSRVYDLGIASTAHKTGKFTKSDFIGEHVVCLLGTDSEPWPHPLPTLIEKS